MTVIAGMTLLLCQAVLGDEPTRVQRLAPRRAMLCRGDDQAAHQQRKADEEKREDTAAVKVSKRADDLGGVHDQERPADIPDALISVNRRSQTWQAASRRGRLLA